MRKTVMTNGIYCSPRDTGCHAGVEGVSAAPAVPTRGTLQWFQQNLEQVQTLQQLPPTKGKCLAQSSVLLQQHIYLAFLCCQFLFLGANQWTKISVKLFPTFIWVSTQPLGVLWWSNRFLSAGKWSTNSFLYTDTSTDRISTKNTMKPIIEKHWKISVLVLKAFTWLGFIRDCSLQL